MAGSSSPEADWCKARRGISLLLNNKTNEAESLFSQHPGSLHLKAGRGFVLFMNALMTFEEDKLHQAVQALRDAERESAPDTGWIRSMRNKVFGSDDTEEDHVARLERQVVLADSQVCVALITMLQQEMSSYVRAGWSLRKAWRVYQQAYNEILQLHRRTFGASPSGLHSLCGTPCGEMPSPLGSPVWPSSVSAVPETTSSYRNEGNCVDVDGITTGRASRSGSHGAYYYGSSSTPASAAPTPSPSGLRSSLSMLFSLAGITSAEQQTPFIEPTEVTRLMSAVSFGYGLFQLSVSLLPPSLLRVIHFLGFEGDRQLGLAALMYARLGEDMRAPLATLALLWYHTIVRPFFALDGANVRAGVESAKQLIAESQPEFANSAVFLFFIGRIERLQSNVNGALRAYEQAVQVSSQREVRLLCLHEVAWCHLIRLSFGDARASLARLQEESRWSKSFYAYLAALCCGAEGDFEDLLSTCKRLAHFMTGSTADMQLAQFISRRSQKLIDHESDRAHPSLCYKLLVYELLYLWSALPACSTTSLRGVLIDCKNGRCEEAMLGLSNLIEGAAYSLLGDREAAVRCYRDCLRRRLPSNDESDQHISAFALYELGCALCNSNNVEEGRCILQRALSQYKDYDFESRLTVRIHAALKKNEVRTLVESRDEFQSKLKELACVMPKLSEAILQLKHEQPDAGGEGTPNSSDNLREVVRRELEMYGADKTGKPDYALEASGGTILSVRDTEPYTIGAPVLKLFGIPICPQQNTPRAVIQTGSLPGECWAFQGSRGSIVIQLLGEVRISEVSIEHISPAVSPTGETSTAPREFSVYGLKNADDADGCLLGKYRYDNAGPSIQFFKVQNDPGRSHDIVEFKFHSNSGNAHYTCIYRIRVHGTLTSNSLSKN
ncbi:hypothetical protein QAD02_017326 [Eretmocerus hayati]|uniref:Uncharacterized protein n=1 Tax=Eretmocerus hayati TaxID=131215 RepID=A0ACC2PD54_9HYME|nr:hypothetical protein QAD02_017326 [Eretmocerus hayati]